MLLALRSQYETATGGGAGSGVGAQARHKFGGSVADWVFTAGSGGQAVLAAGATVQFYDSLSGGLRYTDLQDSGHNPAVTISADANGELPEFYGPAGRSRMAADANTGAGPRRWVFPTDMPSTGAVNVLDFGAKGDGVNDDSAAIAAAITAAPGAGVYLPAGSYLLNSATTLALTVAGTRLYGDGHGAAKLIIGAGFTAAQAVLVTGDACVVQNLGIAGASQATASNPACDGVVVTGAQQVKVTDLFAQWVNGRACKVVGSASRGCLDSMFRGLIARNCACGVHVLGNSGSSFQGELFFTDIQIQHAGVAAGANAGLDGFLIEDCQDVLVQDYNGSVNGGTIPGSALHIKGASTSCEITGLDIGMITLGTVSPTCLVEAGPNGSPSGIDIQGNVCQTGNQGILVTGGIDIRFRGLRIKGNNTDGAAVTGGDQIVFEVCNFATNGASTGTAYDVNLTQTTGFSYILNCIFASTVGGAAGQVTSPANDTSHRGYFLTSTFKGTGTTPGNVFAGTPQIVRDCPGYNPRGQITAATIGASPFTVNTSQNDVSIIFTAVGGMTAFKIGGVSVGAVPQVGVPYRVAARQTVEVDWATTAPTWLWIAD